MHGHHDHMDITYQQSLQDVEELEDNPISERQLVEELPEEGSLLVCSYKDDWMRAVNEDSDCRAQKKETLFEIPLVSSQTQGLEERLQKLELEVVPCLETERSSIDVCIQTEKGKKSKSKKKSKKEEDIGFLRALRRGSDCDLNELQRSFYLPGHMEERISLLEGLVHKRSTEDTTRNNLIRICAKDPDGWMRQQVKEKSRCKGESFSLLPSGVIDAEILESRVTELEGYVWPTPLPSAAPTASPTFSPTFSPTSSPTLSPTSSPTSSPSPSPSSFPSPAPVVPTPQPTHRNNLLTEVTSLGCPTGMQHLDNLGFDCDLARIKFELFVGIPQDLGFPTRSGCSKSAADAVAGGGAGGCTFCDEDDTQNTSRTLIWRTWNNNGGTCVHADLAAHAHDFQELVLDADGVDFCSLDYDVQDGGAYITEMLPTKFESYLQRIFCE